MKYDEDELLKIVGEERKRSIGFGEGDSGELTADREKALQYAKGQMNDVPSLPNRSRAVDSTVADAIETVLPDVLEILIGGDDIATFIPQGEEDEEPAQEESDYITHVVMTENEGFLNAYTVCKDSLLTRTGVFYWSWEENEKTETQHAVPAELAAGAPMLQALAAQDGHDLDAEEQDDGSVNLNQTKKYGKVCIEPVPSEDFTVGADTKSLKTATYCAMRTRPRIQELIARGIDPEKARQLKPYSMRNDTVEIARDEAGEHNYPQDGGQADLRIVEVRAHFIRLAGEDGELTVYRVTTDSEERVMLEWEEVGLIPFAAITPYMVPHRFYGESVADKLIEIQKIKTVLIRAGLDNIYFGLNQRMEVNESQASEHTIADLLRNEPGVPVRSKNGEAVRPISGGPLNVDPWMALEVASTMAESRSGIVRNAQGLNPDTLHATAKGALALMSMAQRRTRMIARIFAETGFKDLYLGVHATLRANYTEDHAPPSFKRKREWKQVQPADWPERNAMAIHVGVGSGGKDHDLAVATQRLELMQPVVMEQGGLEGPLLTANNLHAAFEEWERASGSKKADQFWSDPSDPNAPKPQPKPDPAMAKVQGDLQVEQAKVQAQTQGDAQRAQASLQLDQQKHQAQMQADAEQGAQKLQLQREQMQMEHQLKTEQAAAELQMRREIAAQELELKREVALLQAHQTHEHNMAKVTAGVQKPEVGGAPG